MAAHAARGRKKATRSQGRDAPPPIDSLVARSLAVLRDLRTRALLFEESHAASLARASPYYRNSARNLLHYLSTRQHDIRSLQLDLHSLGMSSLGIMERHVLAAMNAVIRNLQAIAGEERLPEPEPPADFLTGPLLLRDHAGRLFGAEPFNRAVRIMVTMPSEAARDGALVEALLRAGMDVMRINCAHDDATAWRAMAGHLRRAEAVVGRKCRIQADLAGPKMRTGSIEPAGRMLRLRPRHDALGRRLESGRAWFTPEDSPEPAPPGALAVPVAQFEGDWQRAQRLRVTDLRGRARTLRVVETGQRSLLAEAQRKVHFGEGMRVEALGNGGARGALQIGTLPAVVVPLQFAPGDALLLTRAEQPGVAARVDPATGRVDPARIHCTLDAAFATARPGDRVWLDDGKIGGVVRRNDGEQIELGITHAAPGGSKLRPEKGVNFPDTALGLEALTPKDRADLREVVGFVDLVALSFLRTPADVRQLHDELRALEASRVGVVLKIENATAFRNLPQILLESLALPPVGVMVARGDLAVEVGFERLSELQEEILWLCEAAHVPVVWATQVLEGLAKAGAPTRAEVSDAVMSSRAECVMLNKGPRIVDTVHFLSDVLERMAEHHDKRMALLRRLSVSEF